MSYPYSLPRPAPTLAGVDRRLRAELLQAEREEEALIEMGSPALNIWRRADASPLAVLGLEATPALWMGYAE